ncbi:hypothetical protein M407DRAFT_28198 [Tulasnella calospora MUT 4182]|uniref:Uncharacterized protein n=1 Tax=Tulasnella calospora MUT 4182 TaxID=1051891 RepID=A0A0C3Q1U0_9AGAM|nr:hypothetical protein M407DRAFT_28198 [Tulasnella calospora MUT 4182]
MVGTNFVHAVANTYATYAEGLYVDIEVDDVAKEMEVLGSFDVNRASWGVQVPLGQLQYGQTRDVVIRLPGSLSKSPVTVTARCRPWDSDDEVKTTRFISDAHVPPSESTTDPGLLYHSSRLDFVSAVHKEIASGSNSRGGFGRQYPVPSNAATVFKDLASRIRAAFPGEKSVDPSAASDALDLAEDISGQVLLGIADSGAFNKWGLHYLLSLSRSHQRQQCGNFKDPGLKSYGRDSSLFKATRDEIDTTFDNLPPPKPSRSVNPYSGAVPPFWFGGAPPQAGAMLLQQQQPLQQPPAGGLFGSAGAFAPSASSASFAAFAPSAPSVSLGTFGQPQQQSQSGLFSSAGAFAPSASSASFAAFGQPQQQPAGGLFGWDGARGQQQQQQQQQLAQGGLFGSAGAFTPPASSASFKMSKYNRASAPCFAGSSIIQLSSGVNIPVQRLVVGSSVKTPLGSARVTGIVRTYSPNGSFDLCELADSLLITPWHPVYVAEEGKWRFPADIAMPKQTACDSVYSLILEENEDSDGHAVFIGGIRCVTMGHGVADPADVRSHPFLSNHFSVMQALKTYPHFANGRVDALGTVKDTETGLMCGFRWKRDAKPSFDVLPQTEVPSIILGVGSRPLTIEA